VIEKDYIPSYIRHQLLDNFSVGMNLNYITVEPTDAGIKDMMPLFVVVEEEDIHDDGLTLRGQKQGKSPSLRSSLGLSIYPATTFTGLTAVHHQSIPKPVLGVRLVFMLGQCLQPLTSKSLTLAISYSLTRMMRIGEKKGSPLIAKAKML